MDRLIKKFSDIRWKSQEQYYSYSRTDLIPFVQKKPDKILDIGCGQGLTGKLFKETFKASFVAGVEINPKVSEIAKSNLDEIHNLDLNNSSIPYLEDSFDLVILGDIIEHLIEPEKLLKEVYRLLKSDGQVVASIPNIRNIRVLIKLILLGDWRYEGFGVLDRTHLRFFTKKSAIILFNNAGFKILRLGRRFRIPEKILNILTFTIFKDFLAVQNYFSLTKK
jgi:SAM-dependent methyltransferase